jgi:hypothetical protein
MISRGLPHEGTSLRLNADSAPGAGNGPGGALRPFPLGAPCA